MGQNGGPQNSLNYDLSISFDPRVTATYGVKGCLCRYVPEGASPVVILIKDDEGTTTNWSLLTAGGANPTGPAGGVLSGSYPNPTLADDVFNNSGNALVIHTKDLAASSDITLKSGDASAGSSGNAVIATGTATTTRGLVELSGDTIYINAAHAADPVGTFAGQIYFNTVLAEFKFFDGLVWQIISEGTWANQTLSNLTAPTAINEDLIFDKTLAFVKTEDSVVAQTNDIFFKSGNATGFNTGLVTIESGDTDVNSGELILKSGASSAGDSGNVSLLAGTATGTRGQIYLTREVNVYAPDDTNVNLSISTNTPTNPSGFPIATAIYNSRIDASLANTALIVFTNNQSTGFDSGPLGLFTGNTIGATATPTGALLFLTGTVDALGAGSSGIITVSTGRSPSTTGSISVSTGDPNSSSGGSGSLFHGSGNVVDGTSGSNSLSTGQATGAGGTGQINLGTGDVIGVASGGSTGSLTIDSGQITDVGSTGASGNLDFRSGDNAGSGIAGSASLSSGSNSGTGNSGLAYLFSGSAVSGNSGQISIYSGGSSTGTSGNVVVNTGSVTDGGAVTDTGLVSIFSGINSGTGNSGNILLTTGTVTIGTRGQVAIVDGSEGTVGDVFTSTDTGGKGAWRPSAGPVWKKYTVTFTDLSAAALTNDIELFSLPAEGAIHNVAIHQTTEFIGGAIATYTVSVGPAGNLTKYGAAFDVFSAPSDTVIGQNAVFGVEDVGGATSIRVAAVSTGDNLDQATQGSVDIWVLTSTLA